jgi:hypothetical protein
MEEGSGKGHPYLYMGICHYTVSLFVTSLVGWRSDGLVTYLLSYGDMSLVTCHCVYEVKNAKVYEVRYDEKLSKKKHLQSNLLKIYLSNLKFFLAKFD